MRLLAVAGGWYFEWMGYDRYVRHPAWLDPRALVLRAAFETLQAEQEAAAAAAAADPPGGGGDGGATDARPQQGGLWTRLKSKLALRRE